MLAALALGAVCSPMLASDGAACSMESRMHTSCIRVSINADRAVPFSGQERAVADADTARKKRKNPRAATSVNPAPTVQTATADSDGNLIIIRSENGAKRTVTAVQTDGSPVSLSCSGDSVTSTVATVTGSGRPVVIHGSDTRFDFSRLAKSEGVQRIYLPRAAMTENTMWNLLQSDNFLGGLKGAEDFLLLVMRANSSKVSVTEYVEELKSDKRYKLLFEVDNSTANGYGVAFVRPLNVYVNGQNSYGELIFMGRIGFPRKQMVLQVTGTLSQEQIDSFVSTYFEN